LGHRISTSPGNIPRSDQLKAQQKDDSNTHRIHGAAINGNMYHQYTINIPQMLAYIPAPWILWDSKFLSHHDYD
jgi:hypothetical protein